MPGDRKNKKATAAIDGIARDILGLETLEPRRRDALDFHDRAT